MALSLPEARQFWREHPRMRWLPDRYVEVDGAAAVVNRFVSVTGGDYLDVVSTLDDFRLLCVNGVQPVES